MTKTDSSYVSTTNACKLCAPLGASLAFRGIEGAVPFLHGSQGCATYMRRYIISHFREPMDIASSSLGEKHAVYGGAANLKQGLINVMNKYQAQLIGVATTCLTETIGDDVPMILAEVKRDLATAERAVPAAPLLVNVATPSYAGTHMEGFHAAVKAVVEQLATDAVRSEAVDLLPGLLSPADIRHLKEIMEDFTLPAVVLPDFSETLDGPALEDYQKIPAGGTSITAVRTMGGARASIEFGALRAAEHSAGEVLERRYGVSLHSLGTPIGLRETDAFFAVLEQLAGRRMPAQYALERGRLVDSFVDAHKYIFGKRAVVYGEQDLVVGITALLAEIGIKPVLCASGGQTGRFAAAIDRVTRDLVEPAPVVREGVDFYEIAEEAESLAPDLFVGHSKGYRQSRQRNVPLIRVGFPIHDRFGGQRTLHIGYRGAQQLLDSITNAMIEKKQTDSPIGYGYM